MVVELYLLLFSVYALGVGLFVKKLTAEWLWVSFSLSLASVCFLAVGFKNLTLFEFFYGFNLGTFFIGVGSLLVAYKLFNLQTSIGRDLIWIGLLSIGWWSLIFTGDFSTFQTIPVDSFWAGSLIGGTFYHDLKLLILVICLFTVVGVIHRGTNLYEYDYAVLILLGTLSSLLLITQDNLILIYLNLEFQALTLYVITTYYRFEETSSEAGLKYLLVGSLVSGFFLMGIFIFYFYNGSLNLTELSFVNGQTWLFCNFIFKLGAAPFYFWTPSVYQQMDYPSLIFVGSLPKVSVWFLIFKTFAHLSTESTFLYWAGLSSIVIGAIGGLYQLSLSSLIAYSGVLNSGYLLIFCDQADQVQILFMVSLYLIAYYLTLSVVLAGFSFFQSNRFLDLQTFSVVGWFFPFIVYYLFLSLGGLPVLPGFTTKIYLLGYTLERNFFETFMIVFFSLFSVVYYLRVAGFFLFNQPGIQYRSLTQPVKLHLFYQLTLVLGLNLIVQSLTFLLF